MSADETTLLPLLASHPDARRAKAPILSSILFPYLALILGSGVASLAACWNAVMLRRAGLAIRSILVGAAGSLVFYFVVVGLVSSGLVKVSIALILGRILHFAFGGLLYAMHRRHETGNEFLGGPELPTVTSYVVVFAIHMMLPGRVLIFLLGVPNG
jgi:hypothetical protein